ncbi:sulfurtransferase [Paenibacillus turicensis]|uniref:sulfurtransferase n=1 Tax=Paenibacillus turicensis TaxID=160487 RepID=UPI003D2C46A2
MSFAVSIKWLLARLYEPDIVIIDCRFWMNEPALGHQKYTESHLPRAVYLDLDKDLSAPIQAHGGRHPLPDVASMVKTFSKAGITQEHRVVIYDDQQGMVAARVWWMLQYLGHEKTYLMEQGFTAWEQAKFPVSQDQPIVIPASFEPKVNDEWLVSMNEVADNNNTFSEQQVVLIDSRENRRYLGLEEPIDSKAGHIPGAINYFWKDVLQEDGSFKSKEELQQHFAELIEIVRANSSDSNGDVYDTPIIVYCGSGVSACPNILALKTVGFTNVKLYGGSWSDWISYEGNEVVVGEK